MVCKHPAQIRLRNDLICKPLDNCKVLRCHVATFAALCCVKYHFNLFVLQAGALQNFHGDIFPQAGLAHYLSVHNKTLDKVIKLWKVESVPFSHPCTYRVDYLVKLIQCID